MILEVYESHTKGEFIVVDNIGAFTSLRWRRRFLETGEFELHLPPTVRNIQAFQPGRMALREDATEGCIVYDVELTDDDLIVAGRMLSHILKDRVVYPAFSFSGTVEQAMRALVQTYAIDSKPIPMLRLGAFNGFEETCELQVEGKDVLSVLIALAKASLIGFRIRPDVENNVLWFETYKGVDLTNSAEVEQPVEFSMQNKNMVNAKVEQHSAEFYNVAYVAGVAESEDAPVPVVVVDKSAGEYQREVWVKAGDLKKGELSTEEYTLLLEQRGTEALAESQMLSSFSGEMLERAGSEYKTNWDLGDVVSMAREDWGVNRIDTVTEVEEVYEGVTGEPVITPTLGSVLPETLNL